MWALDHCFMRVLWQRCLASASCFRNSFAKLELAKIVVVFFVWYFTRMNVVRSYHSRRFVKLRVRKKSPVSLPSLHSTWISDRPLRRMDMQRAAWRPKFDQDTLNTLKVCWNYFQAYHVTNLCLEHLTYRSCVHSPFCSHLHHDSHHYDQSHLHRNLQTGSLPHPLLRKAPLL